MSMIKDYFDIYTEKVQEYGEKTIVLYQNGSFFEIFEKDEGYPESEKIGNAKILSEILQMKYTGKSLGKFINFIGFTKSVVDKYLPILLNEGYTIVIVNELETSSNKVGKGNLKRGITAIHSPSLSTVCTTETNLVGILLEIPCLDESRLGKVTETQIKASFCCVNNLTNDIELTEETYGLQLNSKNLTSVLDELYRILYRYFPKELQVKIICSSQELIVNIETFLKEKYDSINIKIVQLCSTGDYKKETFQNEYFSNVYKHLNPGLLSYFEFLELNKLNVNSVMNFMYTLDFMGRHSLSYISNLNKPKIIKECNYLVLELNTLNQLNIINQHNKTQSLLHIIDFTKTVIGKRYLKNLLCKPLKDFKEIESRYTLTEELAKSKVSVSDFLEKICDFERLHRKMGLQELHPYEFEKLHKTYLVLISLIELIIKENIFKFIQINNQKIDEFKNYIKEYIKLFNLNEMKNHSLNSTKDTIVNYFNKGQIESLDTIQTKIDTLETTRETLRLYYNNLIDIKGETNVKLEYTERDGYSFSCTKLRYTSLLSKLEENEKKQLKVRNNVSNTTKFYTDELIKLSGEILANRELLTQKIKLNYLQTINKYYTKYTELFNTLKTFVEIIDITNSNYIGVKKYNYTKPEIIESKNETSFIQAKQLKHPIIESLGINYVPNDIILDDTQNGMLVFGVNASGKSSLLRAIGINIILAQCGLYVPCRHLKFSPFNTIISQVDLTDDLFSGKSSFINEMNGLKKILECSGKNTLVLSDECCKGTEVNSATSIVTSTILTLINNGTKFFFTSHLHDISKVKQIIDSNFLQINHLSVNVKDNSEIIFERKLELGSGSDLYGLEICKSIINNNDFIDTAFKIRNDLVGEKVSVLSTKKSRYNKKKIIDKCQLCESTESLEVDHIEPQEYADENGFLSDGRHKSHISNLCTLCKSCHLKKTLGKIRINGYKMTTNGQILDWEQLLEKVATKIKTKSKPTLKSKAIQK